MREMGSKPMREFRIPLSIVDSDTLSRAQAIARYRWGTSVRVSLEAGILTAGQFDGHRGLPAGGGIGTRSLRRGQRRPDFRCPIRNLM